MTVAVRCFQFFFFLFCCSAYLPLPIMTGCIVALFIRMSCWFIGIVCCVFYGEALLCNCPWASAFFCFEKLVVNGCAYTIAISINLPFAHLGHRLVSLPYCSSMRCAAGIFSPLLVFFTNSYLAMNNNR